MFTIKSNYDMSEVDSDSIIEWEKNILPEGNMLKKNFYTAKPTMKPLGLG